MRLTAVFILMTLIGLTVASPPDKKCYKKVTKCCYKFNKCGFKVREKKYPYRCDVKKCEDVCDKPRCYKKYSYRKHKYVYKCGKKKCYHRCYYVHKTCYKITVFKTPKFCPHLSCKDPVIEGDDKKPDDYYGKEYFAYKKKVKHY